jgi:NADH dehydrogenase
VVHIYFLAGFKNRFFVVLHWVWSYMTFKRGARLIVERDWHSFNIEEAAADSENSAEKIEKQV